MRRLCRRLTPSFLIIGHLAVLPIPMAYSAPRHTFGLNFEQSEQTVQGTNNSTEIQPKGWQWSYGLGLDEHWSLFLSGNQIEDDKHWTSDTELSFESSSYSLSAEYRMSPWWISAGWQQGEEELNFQRTSRSLLRDEFDTTVLTVWAGREIDTGAWLFDLSLGLDYQRQSGRTQSQIQRRVLLLEEQSDQDSDGLAVGASLVANYLVVLTDDQALIPGVGLSWSEPVTGETSGSLSRSTRLGNRTRISQGVTSETQASDSGTGALDFSLSYLFKDFGVSALYSIPVEDDVLGDRWVLGVSYSL